MSAAALSFDGPTHTYRFGGRKVPSVTTVLEPYSGLHHVDPELLAAAAEFGTHVHDACDLYNRGKLDWSALSEPLIPYVQGWENFLNDTGAVVTASEQRVWHPRLMYAGTLDNVVHWKKSQHMIDIKTGTTVPKSVGPQTAAYSEAWKVETKQRLKMRYCCHLLGEGRYNLITLNDPQDWSIFKAALLVHRWHTGE